VIPAVAVGLLLIAAQSEANIAPDAMVYFNVRPLGPPEELCQTDIDHCSEMRPSTPEQGMLEFQIFIDPQQWMHGAIPVPHFTVDLTWPEAWTFMGGDMCRGALWGTLEYEGPSPHRLELEWPCTVPDGLFLAVTLVFDVQGYGTFGPSGDCTLTLGCSQPEYVTPAAQFAEAGTECEYTNQPCRTGHWLCCEASFSGPELALSGAEGETAHGEMDFTVADLCPHCSGSLHVHSETPWITGQVVDGEHFWEFILAVDADLTGVAPGEYQSEVEVEEDESVARCLPVTVTVRSAAAVDETALGPSGPVPLNLRVASANPFSGPFVLTYVNPAAAWVRCGVYDVSGREIARLLEGEQSGGPHTITWGAADASGDRVRPGVYAIRLEAGAVVRSRQVVVVR
jgi:hypothetical protein